MRENPPVAIVTGANKGIGFEIVRGLCEKFNGIVYLTARNHALGTDAVEALRDEGYDPRFHMLDVTNDWSIHLLHDHMRNKHGGVDILVNNAAVAFNISLVETKENIINQAKTTIRTNYFGVLRVSNSMFPILRKGAQVVNLSSSCGHLSNIPSENLRNRFADPTLTEDKLSELIKEYKDTVKSGTSIQCGWGSSPYAVSKVGVCALTRIQQLHFNTEAGYRNISVNSVHPGFVNTDMTNHKGVLSPEEGAKAPLYLALEPHGLKGEFVWFDNTVVNWLAPTYPEKWT